MNPLFHLIAVSPVVFILYPEIGLINSLFLFVGGWLFDIDHYLYCIFKHKNFSLKDCYNFHSPYAKEKDLLHIFHVIEFYIFIFIIGIFVTPFIYLFLGLMYHQIFDLSKIIYFKIKKDPRLKNARAISLIMWIRRHSPSNSTKLKTL